MHIAGMDEAYWPQVADIYQQGIDSGHATFAPAPPESWAAWTQARINPCSLVALDGETVLGWAALSPVSGRCVYAGVAEVSIYVGNEARRSGVGSCLMQALIDVSEQHGIWTLQAGIFPENSASLALHARFGFRMVGKRERLGKMTFGPLAGRWRDVLWLERRSAVAGID